MRGHIRLGADINDFRDYLLVNDAKIRQRILANPMAAKLGQGAGKYDDLTNWSGWVMENWQAGLGKREADAEGFLYAELETRFQGQLCLPLYYDMLSVGYAATQNHTSGISDILDVSSSGTVQKLAVRVTSTSATNRAYYAWVMLFDSYGVNSTVKIYTDVAGSPGAEIYTATGTVGSEISFDYRYHAFNVASSFTSGSNFWLIIYPTSGTLQIPVYTNVSAASTRKEWNGSAWVDSRYSFFYRVNSNGAGAEGANDIAQFNSLPHLMVETNLYKYNGTALVSAKSGLAPAYALQPFGDTLFAYYRNGGGFSDLQSWDGTTLTSHVGVEAEQMAAWNGYLWRAYQNDVWYSADGTTWTGPIQIGPDGYTVTGIAGMGEDMYASTEEALYKIGAGDLVSGVMRFATVSNKNGRGMINHQGALIIPTKNDLLRYGGAEIMSISPMRDEGLPGGKQGSVVTLGSHNYWLFALLTSTTTQNSTSWPLVLAYNDQGWHYVGKLLQQDVGGTTSQLSGTTIHWDADYNFLWVQGDFACYRFRLPVDHQNPYKDYSGNVRFFPGGTLETPWFYSGLKEIRKDCESVYITGENISSSRPVKVYWKDDDSTEWEFLGTVTSNRQELRWDDPDTRPNTRQIKLGIVMMTDDYTQTPRVDAIRLKYQNMVADRWRWQLSVNVSDNQEMLDSDLNIYTKEQQRTHLETLIRSVGPILFEDVDGVQYEVKVLGASEQVERYEYIEDAPNFTSVYSLTVEQATTTSYN